MRKLLFSFTAGVAALSLSAAVPTASNVVLTSDPATHEVTVTYSLSAVPAIVTLGVETNAGDNVWVAVDGSCLRNVLGDAFCKITAQKESYSISWRPDGAGRNLELPANGTRAVLRVYEPTNPPDYMAVSLCVNSSYLTRYYPDASYVPGGVTDVEYKTSTLLLRRIRATGAAFTMGTVNESGRKTDETTHRAELSADYYIGVYQITQRQWYMICGRYPAYWGGTCRPVEGTSYARIRMGDGDASNAAYDWPNAPHPDSFLGRLRTLTGGAFAFDLPCEAQWEFAARAGNGEGHLGRADTAVTNGDLVRVARCKYNGGQLNWQEPPQNVGPEYATANVGTYLPNDWGLYDMLGSVGEWCVDWYQADITGNDAQGVALNGRPNVNGAKCLDGSTGVNKVIRSGSYAFMSDVSTDRPGYRNYYRPPSTCERYTGFRVVSPLPHE